MRLLVCGGRAFNDLALLRRTLDHAHAADPITVLIHGTARGADRLAGQWAIERNIRVEPYRPDWDRYGIVAGPMRNRRMLREGRPDKVIAFKGGDGTADMIRQARDAQVPVQEIT